MVLDLVAAAVLGLAAREESGFNPNAHELFERSPVLMAWALRRFDRNTDGWLTIYEAQPALAAFRDLADANRDGRVSVQEFKAAEAFVSARDNLPRGASAPVR